MASSEQTTEVEVTAVKKSYPGQCRVTKDVGAFSHVITVQPSDMDATIKFQIPATYPQETPTVSIRSGSLTSETISDITANLCDTAATMKGKAMLQSLIDEASKQLAYHGLRPGKTIKVTNETDLCEGAGKRKKTRKPKKKSGPEDEVIDEKLPPMKTASDVVNRIIWDEALEKDDFIVGYFDRFRGLVEKSFSAFSWEDLASVDYDVLAVPKHRIQYFKYKDVKVWDKPRRLDNVFGSAKGTKTIDVVIREVEEAARTGAEAAKESGSDGSGDSYTDDDSDDDDGIVVTIGSSSGIGIGIKPKGEGDRTGEGQGQEVEAGRYDPYWRDKLRPNYFLCVRLTDETILDKVSSVQDHLMQQEPILAECCIPGASMHVTLCTLGLDTAPQVQMCVDALNKVKTELGAALPDQPLHLHGVGHFYDRVVYARVHDNPGFLAFCDQLKTLLREAGVQMRDGYEFVPHATIMKTTRPVSRLRGSKEIDPDLYSRFRDLEFGQQQVESIYLCSMDKSRRKDGFYLTPLELHFR